jgi:hypothetical protein
MNSLNDGNIARHKIIRQKIKINYLGASPQGIQRKKPDPLRRRASGNKTHLMGFKVLFI